MRPGFALTEREGAEELHNRNEPLCLVRSSVDKHLVTSRGKEPVEGSAESAQYNVVHIPRPHSERFTCIEIIPRVGRTESRDVQKTFINYRQRITHRFLPGFADLNLKLLSRPKLIRHCYNRFKPGLRIFYYHRDHTIKPHWHVVKCLGMWLYDSHICIDIGSHFRFCPECYNAVAFLSGCADLFNNSS